MSQEILVKPESEWTEEEQTKYYKHAEYSLVLLQEKKIVLPSSVQTMILQHHERQGGKGFPNAVSEPKLKLESQLLALADEFETLTQMESGRPVMDPIKALNVLYERNEFNIDMIKSLLKVFGASVKSPNAGQ